MVALVTVFIAVSAVTELLRSVLARDVVRVLLYSVLLIDGLWVVQRVDVMVEGVVFGAFEVIVDQSTVEVGAVDMEKHRP